MSGIIVEQICASIQFELHVDTNCGCPILIPMATVASFLTKGVKSHIFTVDFDRPRDTAKWITLAEAARLHESDVDGMTFEKARFRIRRAIETGKIVATGDRKARRIDPNSLAAWRLDARERGLDDEDDDL